MIGTTSYGFRYLLMDERLAPPSRGELDAFLDPAVRAAERAGARLAIENHFRVPCRILADLAERTPRDRVMFCVDAAKTHAGARSRAGAVPRNQVPANGCRDADIAADGRWLSESLGNLRSLL